MRTMRAFYREQMTAPRPSAALPLRRRLRVLDPRILDPIIAVAILALALLGTTSTTVDAAHPTSLNLLAYVLTVIGFGSLAVPQPGPTADPGPVDLRARPSTRRSSTRRTACRSPP